MIAITIKTYDITSTGNSYLIETKYPQQITNNATYNFNGDIITSGGNYIAKIYRSDDNTFANKTEMDSHDIGATGTYTKVDIVAKYYAANCYIIYVVFKLTANPWTTTVIAFVTINNGANWAHTTYDVEEDAVGFTANFAFGTLPYDMVGFGSNNPLGVGFYKYKLVAPPYETIIGKYTKGWQYGNTFYYLAYDTAGDDYYIRKFANVAETYSTHESLSTSIFSGGSDIDMSQSFFWTDNGTQFMVGWKDSFYFYSNAIQGWKKVTAASGTYPIPNYYIDGTGIKIRGVIFGNKYITLNSARKIIMYELSVTFTTGSAWDDYVVAGTTVYQFTTVTNTNILSIDMVLKREEIPQITIESITELADECHIAIYNASAVLQGRGNVKGSQDSVNKFTCILESLIGLDLEKEIDYTALVKTVHEMVDEIIAAEFEYGSGGTISSSATTYNYTCVGRKIREILTEICHMDGRTWYCTANDQLNVDVGTTDSTIDIKSSAGNSFYGTVRIKDKMTVGCIELWGKNGAYTIKYGTFGNARISDTLFDLTQTELEAYAIQQLSIKGSTSYEYICTDYTGAGTLILPGYQIDWEAASPYTVADAKHYVYSIRYDPVNDIISELVLHTALKWKGKTPKTTETAIQYTRQVDQTGLKLSGGTMTGKIISGRTICALTKSGNQTITNASWENLDWETELLDTDTMHDTAAANDHKITFTTAGTYRVDVTVNMATRIGEWYLRVIKNVAATELVRGAIWVDSTGWYPHISVYIVATFAAGDYIIVDLYNSTGADKDCLASSFFMAERVD